MGVKLSKDEKEYIESNAVASYLLLKHDSSGGIDCFSVYNQGGDKEYSINVKGKYRKELPVLEISDETGSVVGTIRWNDESPSSNVFSVWYVGNSGRIEKKYEENKRFFRKSWYESSFSDWTLDYHTVYFGNGYRCAEINSISNYKKDLRGEKKIRDSYLIDRYYNTENIANDVLVLLFWAITYICEDYHSIHDNPHPVYIQKSKLETKLDDSLEHVKSSLDDRKDTIEQRQEDAVKELHNRAREYVDDKQARLQEKADSKSTLQKVLWVLLKILICLAAPVVGLFALAFISQHIVIPFRINLNFAAAIFFIAAILIVNRGNPGLVVFYEWLKLILLCVIGLIACSYLEAIIEQILGMAGVKGVDVGFPLILFVIAGNCKLMSRHLDRLVGARSVLSMVQFISIGILLGRVCLRYIDRYGRFPILVSVVVIVVAIALSKAKILVRKSVKHCIIGAAVGVLLVCFVGPVIKMLLH